MGCRLNPLCALPSGPNTTSAAYRQSRHPLARKCILSLIFSSHLVLRQSMEFQRPPDTFGLSAIAVLAALALFLLALLIRIILKRRQKGAAIVSMQKCRWKKDKKALPRASFTAWRCATCGVEAYSSDGRAPKECKRSLRHTKL